MLAFKSVVSRTKKSKKWSTMLRPALKCQLLQKQLLPSTETAGAAADKHEGAPPPSSPLLSSPPPSPLSRPSPPAAPRPLG